MVTAEVSSAASGVDPGPGPRARRLPWLLGIALVLVVTPFVAAAVRVLLTRDASFQLAGDQAIIGLAAHDASNGQQLVGPYSRYGWAHPGPAWFYLLAPVTRLAGADDAALVAASLLVHALVAAVFVAAVHRRAQPAVAVLAAGVLLLFVLRMPAAFFVDVWNPYALLPATALLLVLAARVRDGRWRSLLGLLIAGSYLVQTHVGTAPLVGLVGIVGLVAFAVGRRAPGSPTGRAADTPGTARRWWPEWALAAVLTAMWVPPLVQQLTAPAGLGNLGRLTAFFLDRPADDPGRTLVEGATAAGRILVMGPYGWGPGPGEMDVSTLPAAVAVGLVAQVLASALLIVAGRLLHDPAGTWCGLLTLTALVAAVLSATTVVGPIYSYLLTWVSVIPAVTLLGGAVLAVSWRRRGPGAGSVAAAGAGRAAGVAAPARSRPVLAVLVVLLVAGSAAGTVSLGRALAGLPASPGVAAATGVVDRALAAQPVDDIEVDLATHGMWPIGSGVVTELIEDGWTVRVNEGAVDLFGADRVSAGEESIRLVLAVPADVPAITAQRGELTDLGTVETELGPLTILLQTGR